MGEASVRRWAAQFRDVDHVLPRKKRGGTRSDVSVKELEAILDKHPDAMRARSLPRTTLAAGAGPPTRFEHQASTAPLRVRGEKKRLRALEQLRPDVAAKREAFVRMMRRLPADRLVFIDESGLNASMTRTHAWVKKGHELVSAPR